MSEPQPQQIASPLLHTPFRALNLVNQRFFAEVWNQSWGNECSQA